MNLSEFKAWFEGFTENLNGQPNQKQWARIKSKIAEIKDAPPTSYPIYIDRWVRPYWWWGPYYGYTTGGNIGLSAQSNSGGVLNQQQSFLGMQCENDPRVDSAGPGTIAQWNSADAFRELGRAEAQSIA